MAQMVRSMFIFVWERDRDASTFLSRLASINRDVHPRTINSVISRWLQSWLKPQFSLHSTGMITPLPILWAIPVRKALDEISRNWRPYSFASFAANLCSMLSINPCYYYNPDLRAEALMCRTSNILRRRLSQFITLFHWKHVDSIRKRFEEEEYCQYYETLDEGLEDQSCSAWQHTREGTTVVWVSPLVSSVDQTMIMRTIKREK